jgi:hypothetical protein
MTENMTLGKVLQIINLQTGQKYALTPDGAAPLRLASAEHPALRLSGIFPYVNKRVFRPRTPTRRRRNSPCALLERMKEVRAFRMTVCIGEQSAASLEKYMKRGASVRTTGDELRCATTHASTL